MACKIHKRSTLFEVAKESCIFLVLLRHYKNIRGSPKIDANKLILWLSINDVTQS